MHKNTCFFALVLILISVFSLASQTHTSVLLDHPVYYVLEQAQMRGLCSPLPGAKPYSRALILEAINEILGNEAHTRFGGLTEQERGILENARKTFSPSKKGLDWGRGSYYFESPQEGIHFSGDLGLGAEFLFSSGIYPGDTVAWATDNWLNLSFKGDLGTRLSYGFTVFGGVMRSPRSELGLYNTYYPGYPSFEELPEPSSYYNQQIPAYSEALAFFPYTYKKRWDGFVWSFSKIDNSGQLPWPQDPSIGYSMLPELAGTLLNNHITYRFARLDREWGGMTNGSSITFNQSAQPFLAIETTVRPFNWLIFSSLSGVLEYYNAKGIKDSAESSQNLFSISMVEVNYKQYLHFDVGSTALWPKRFELGYLFPLADNFFYQNNIGDFDNMSLFFDLKGQYPGIGKLWFSFFLDEINPERAIFELDKSMYAFQLGTTIHLPIPVVSFSSITLSYTKIEPYCYTHTRVFVPWYGQIPMETSYTNNGRSLGSYLPPNSDEILLRFETMPTLHSAARLQYQMIRHGADYGSSAVDGSSLWSELDPSGRSEKPILRKYFLQDGAYQWMHIVKLGGEYSFTQFNAPITLFGEVGVVFSYFTNIEGPANSGSPSVYSVIDSTEYPHSTSIIATIGIKVFPK
ncbi:MAG: hypothetical protein LBD29_10410 [Treponema sp.]|jgi:hypothetical protein|nr:hypothetical protein [Treponema sp.]